MKPLLLLAVAQLALTACNMMPTSKGTGSTDNMSSSAAPAPDSVVINGVTYVKAGSNSGTGSTGSSSSSDRPTTTTSSSGDSSDSATGTSDSSESAPPPPSDGSDGVKVSGGH